MLMLMLTGGAMAAPVHGGVDHINHAHPLLNMKSWTYSTTIQLSKIVGETQMDFVRKVTSNLVFLADCSTFFIMTCFL